MKKIILFLLIVVLSIYGKIIDFRAYPLYGYKQFEKPFYIVLDTTEVAMAEFIDERKGMVIYLRKSSYKYFKIRKKKEYEKIKIEIIKGMKNIKVEDKK